MFWLSLPTVSFLAKMSSNHVISKDAKKYWLGDVHEFLTTEEAEKCTLDETLGLLDKYLDLLQI